MGQRSAAPPPVAPGAPLRVYISYSRAADAKFADELASGLGMLSEFQVSIDRSDIHEGDDWQARLAARVRECETVVVVLSPRAAVSPICRFEVKEAAKWHKRIVPVLAQPLAGTPPPPETAKLPLIRFDDRHAFMAGLGALREALNGDREWLGEHRRLTALAQQWDEDGRPSTGLLHSSDVATAHAWLASQPSLAPLPPRVTRDFIRESDQARIALDGPQKERADRLQARIGTLNTLIGILTIGLLAAGGYIYVSTSRFAAAQEAREIAVEAQVRAIQARQTAEEQEKRLEDVLVKVFERILAANGPAEREPMAVILQTALSRMPPGDIDLFQRRVEGLGQFRKDPDGAYGPRSDQAVENWIDGLATQSRR